jgi:hypothetical protein
LCGIPVSLVPRQSLQVITNIAQISRHIIGDVAFNRFTPAVGYTTLSQVSRRINLFGLIVRSPHDINKPHHGYNKASLGPLSCWTTSSHALQKSGFDSEALSIPRRQWFRSFCDAVASYTELAVPWCLVKSKYKSLLSRLTWCPRLLYTIDISLDISKNTFCFCNILKQLNESECPLHQSTLLAVEVSFALT